MHRGDDDRVLDHQLFKGQTRPKLVNVMGYEMTHHSRIIAIVASMLMTIFASFGASLVPNPWAILWALAFSTAWSVSLFTGAIWLCKIAPRWPELFRFWFVTRFEAALSGSLAFWKASAFSPLVVDLPDSRGRRRRTVSLLLRRRQ